MDQHKKQLKSRRREQQRSAAFAELPLPVQELKAMFDMLDEELARKGCDHMGKFLLAHS